MGGGRERPPTPFSRRVGRDTPLLQSALRPLKSEPSDGPGMLFCHWFVLFVVRFFSLLCYPCFEIVVLVPIKCVVHHFYLLPILFEVVLPFSFHVTTKFYTSPLFIFEEKKSSAIFLPTCCCNVLSRSRTLRGNIFFLYLRFHRDTSNLL